MSHSLAWYVRRFLAVLLSFIFGCIIFLVVTFYIVSAPPAPQREVANVINDVTQINPIEVTDVAKPHSVDEIVRLVSHHNGKISIGGARHSMGGQIGLENSLHLDMREFNEVVNFSAQEKIITVQSGITWRKIQEYIDPYDLSVMIMQTYADFTVGGSLSVNVHGRYIGHGPIIHSVKSVKVVLADGSTVVASPTENLDLFRGVIGGYGGLGVIVEATLQLEKNDRVKRSSQVMALDAYSKYFVDSVRMNRDVVFHNADIYPDDYTKVRAVSYKKSDSRLTEEERLTPVKQSYRVERFAMWVVSEFPGGKWIREHWGDPAIYAQEKVCWRNYEASYNAVELEPTSRSNSTYVLQEYFIPVNRFDSFVPNMAAIFQKHDVNVINVSIRHARPDTVSLLSWAPQEVFCFVVYYKHGTDKEDVDKVGIWTREMIKEILNEDGSYYLPYQLHATPQQFNEAYPKSLDYFRLKQHVDPMTKFSNKLWEKYFSPASI